MSFNSRENPLLKEDFSAAKSSLFYSVEDLFLDSKSR